MRTYKKEPTAKIPDNFFYFYLTDTESFDIIPIECGTETCRSDKEILKRCYNYYALHCVNRGKGYYVLRNKIYTVEKNQIFCFFPGENIEYYPDKDDPWEYTWVNFVGVKAKDMCTNARFSVQDPIYTFTSPEIYDIFSKMVSKYNSDVRDLFSTAYIYELLATITEERGSQKQKFNEQPQNYISAALSYINKNLGDPNLSLKLLAAHLGLSESYLSRLFKKNFGTTFVNYVKRSRIAKACSYLEHTDYLNKEIAHIVGYDDPLYFSKNFREITGLSSYEYKKICATKKPKKKPTTEI